MTCIRSFLQAKPVLVCRTVSISALY